MSRLRVAPIVEGHGDEDRVRILLPRVWTELLGGEYLEVLSPIRQPRSLLVREDPLERAVTFALKKLSNPPASSDPSLVLILIDADGDCPATLGQELLRIARAVDSRANVACVLANFEYETWFVAAAESLTDYIELTAGAGGFRRPEESGLKKKWVEDHFREKPYSPTRHQPAMTRAMNLNAWRQGSPSFDKLCRELERRVQGPGSGR